MGTSKGYSPPAGANWTPLKGEITDFANHLDTYDNDKKQKVSTQIISDFITAIGGSEGFSRASRNTKSSSGGTILSSKAGRTMALRLGNVFSSIRTNGLRETLQNQKIDYSNLTIDELEKKLLESYADTASNEDIDAANKAMSEVVIELFQGINNIDELETKIMTIIETENILCSFYEKYLFKRFKRKFEEDSIKKYGIDKTSKMMFDIEKSLTVMLKTYQCDKKLTEIDFSTKDGDIFVQAMLEQLVEYLEDYTNE
ncbi:hypothetical protein [Aliarcobacter butzleri]|uniref:hypothetical protein n=1 Tax=Aliarcobacter butzleri TaxID=28197 RepID=UPI00215AFC6A|nr:hypothetical protein [Aliarcobacter butzleri]MCR8710998.1 hypothetical protein [Aliarcobacter butzleri]